jgi:prepilin-type processing-associated H-X9-DG protein
MSRAVGTCGGADHIPNGGPSTGLWLNGTSAYDDKLPWYTYGKISSSYPPGPANVLVFMDEDEASIGVGAFFVTMTSSSWIGWPGTRHGYTASISFLDGHAEVHKWKDGRTRNVNKNHSATDLAGKPVSQPGNVDIEWLQSHTSAHK